MSESKAPVGREHSIAVKPQPNSFELEGGSMKVSYASTSFAGAPQLRYEDAAGSKDFSGNEIEELDTEIGRLVTVKTEKIHGTATPGTTLTVLIPIFDKEGEASFTTKAIITTYRTTGGGELGLHGGALQTYRVEELAGTATKKYY